jgi:endoglucanase
MQPNNSARNPLSQPLSLALVFFITFGLFTFVLPTPAANAADLTVGKTTPDTSEKAPPTPKTGVPERSIPKISTPAANPPTLNNLNPPPAANPVGRGYWSTQGNKIVDEDGQQVRIAGINWSGAQTAIRIPHGIWASSYKRILDLVKSLGYNTIRLPISDQMVYESLNRTVVITTGNGTTVPPTGGIDLFSNAEFIGKTHLEALDLIIDYAGQIGLRILLNRHKWVAQDFEDGIILWYPTNAQGDNANWLTEDTKWTQLWGILAERYRYTTTVIGADLHNEPHAPDSNPAKICWGCVPANVLNNTPGFPVTHTNSMKDWRLAAERAAKAIHEKNPHWLVFVEGIDTHPSGNNYNWWGGQLMGVGSMSGGQFVATAPIRTIVPNKVVYSPHEYGPSLYCQPWFSDPNYNNLPARWDMMWGNIHKSGFAPVMLGEFGTDLRNYTIPIGTNQTRDGCRNGGTSPIPAVPRDDVWFDKMMAYLNNPGAGIPPMGYTYWALNPNTELGGILNDLQTWQSVVVTIQNRINPSLFPLSKPNQIVVGKTTDFGQGGTSGTLSWALKKDAFFYSRLPTQTMPIVFKLENSVDNKIYLSGGYNPALTLRPGLSLVSSCNTLVTINGAGVSTANLPGLILKGNNTLRGLRIEYFPGEQILTQGTGSVATCVFAQSRK